MQYIKGDKEISIPSIDSEEVKDILFHIEESCEMIRDLQSEKLNNKDKKEIIQMASDKEGGTENGIESLTQINIVINDYSELRELMINALKKKVSSLSKKIIKNKSIKER